MTEPFTHVGAPSEPARYAAPTVPGTSERTAPGAPVWSLSQRVAFRFVFAYLLLFVTSKLGDVLRTMERPYDALWRAVVPWVGAHVLHLATPITVFPNGSSDTTFNYVSLLCFVVVALVATVVWSIVDRKRPNYVRLHHYLRIYIRYALAFIMLSYGCLKLLKQQFDFLSFYSLLEPYGQSSPMGLLWTMMGYSTAYNVYAGLVEAAGGMLLFWRRTTTLGALLVMAAMSNVVMLNFSYDVPVKIFSTHLFLMALFLAAPELRRVADALLFGRAVRAETAIPHTARRTWRRAQLALKTLLILYAVGGPLWQSWPGERKYGLLSVKPPLYGVWEVMSFARNHHEVPPLLTDTMRWRYVLTTPAGGLGVVLPNYVPDVPGRLDTSGDFAWFKRGGLFTTIDPVARSMVLVMHGDRTRMPFTYATPDSSHLELTGVVGSDSLHVTLRRVEFPLVNRGFRLVNEHPYNR